MKEEHTYYMILLSVREGYSYVSLVHQGKNLWMISRHNQLFTTHMLCLYLEISQAVSANVKRYSKTHSSLTSPSYPYLVQDMVEESGQPREVC